MAASVAIDLQNIDKRIDLSDASNATDRNIQSAYSMICQVAQVCADIKAPGAGKYQMPERIDEADRAAYESNIDDIATACASAALPLRTILFP